LKNFDYTNETSLKGQHAIGSQDNSPLQSKESTQHRSRSRAKLFFIVAGTLFVVFVSIELIFHAAPTDVNKASAKRTVSVQLEVLNGTAEPKAAQRLTEALRSGGFDVVDMGNYKSSSVARTTVIGRTADRSAALSVASYLGVDKNSVLQQPDKNLYLDVSVIIGKDINQLRVFK
jgi:hypothetical protein